MRRLGSAIFLYSLLVLGVVYAITRPNPSRWSIYLVGVIVAGTTAVLAWLHRLYPPPFDIEPGHDSVAFTFGELSLGYDFRAMNPEAHEAGGLTSA